MKEGEILKDFIEQQRVRKTTIAKDLDMTRSNLYQLFDSATLEPETKEKFEGYFKTKIFPEGQSFLEKRRTLKNGDHSAGIPIYEDSPFTLSNIESYRDTKPMEPDFWVTIPGLRKCNYGCRATGDSMHPLIRNHALVVGEEVDDLSFILFGDIYIIQTKNNIETIKYIHPHEADASMLMLVPYNEKAKSTPIRKEDILKLYRAKAVFNVL